MNDYPRYVFLGNDIAFVANENERSELSGWSNAPEEGFVHNLTYNSVLEVPEDQRNKVADKEPNKEVIEVKKPKLRK